MISKETQISGILDMYIQTRHDNKNRVRGYPPKPTLI